MTQPEAPKSPTLVLTFTVDDLKIIDEVLGNSGPHKVIAPLIDKINKQLRAQMPAPTVVMDQTPPTVKAPTGE